jgi:hypothetical protein
MVRHVARYLIAVGLSIALTPLLATAHAQQASGSVFQITRGPNGTINVVAACAPIEALLSALAKADGCQAEFAEPLTPFVSLSDSDAFKSPEQWIYDVDTPLNIKSSRDGNTWYFDVLFPDRYDPTLTASEVLSRFQRQAQPSTPAKGVRGAVLLLNGQYVPAPYAVTMASISGGYRIDVNGLRAVDITELVGQQVSLPAQVTPGIQLRDYDELIRYVSMVLYPSLRKSMDTESALKQAAAFLRTQDIVTEAAVTDEHPRLWITREGDILPPLSWSALPENYDLDTAKPWGTETAPLRDRVELQAEVLGEQLERPALIVQGKTGTASIPGLDSLRQTAGILRDSGGLDVLQLECELAQVLEDRQLAREVAANAGQNPAPLLAALDDLIQRKETALGR